MREELLNPNSELCLFINKVVKNIYSNGLTPNINISESGKYTIEIIDMQNELQSTPRVNRLTGLVQIPLTLCSKRVQLFAENTILFFTYWYFAKYHEVNPDLYSDEDTDKFVIDLFTKREINIKRFIPQIVEVLLQNNSELNKKRIELLISY